jgi:YD repeat-containing protein
VVTYPTGRVETLTLNSYFHFKKPTTSTDAAGATHTTYDASGRRASFTNQRGVQTTYEYAGERVSAVTQAVGTPAQRRTETDWDAPSDTLTERRVLNAQDDVIARQTYTYNARRQLLTSTQHDPNSNATRTTTRSYCEAPSTIRSPTQSEPARAATTKTKDFALSVAVIAAEIPPARHRPA